MARLGRSQPDRGSILRPPTVVYPAVVFHGPGVKLASPLTRGDVERRRASSTLRPPAVVDAAASPEVFSGPRVELARQITRGVRQRPTSELRTPAVVAPAVVWHGPGVKLAPPLTPGDVERRRASWTLRPPTVVDAAAAAEVFSGPKVKLARAKPGDPRRKAQYDLAAAIVVFPKDGFGGIGTSLADSRNARSDGRRAPHSRLSEPAVVDAAAAAFIADPVRVSRAEAHKPAAMKPELRAPEVVAPADVYPGPRVTHAPSHLPTLTRPHLAPPSVVEEAEAPFVAAPVRVTRAIPPRPVPPHSKFTGPAIVAPAPFVADPVRLARADSHRPAATRYELRAPAVVDAEVVPADVYPVRVSLAESHRPPDVRARLAPPVVIGPADIYGPLRVALAKVRQARPVGRTRLAAPAIVGPVELYGPVRVALTEARETRLVQSEIRPPAIVDIPAQPPVDTQATVSLAPSRDVARRLAHSRLRPPEVVGPAVVYPSVSTAFAPHPRQSRASHSTLSPPSSVDPAVVYPSVATALAPQPRQGRVARSTLSPPTVVEPFIASAIRVTRAPGQELGLRRPARSTLRDPVFYPPVEITLRFTLTAHPQRREYTYFRTPIFGILDVLAPVLGHFDEPTPAAAFFDEPTPAGAAFDEPTPSAGSFDRSGPSAAGFDEPTPTAGHFDEPTPS